MVRSSFRSVVDWLITMSPWKIRPAVFKPGTATPGRRRTRQGRFATGPVPLQDGILLRNRNPDD
jgi:hypothetical protein